MIEKLSPEAKTMLNDFLNQIDYEKGKEIERLNNIINELQERIDKAIEYIENNVLSYIDEDGLESITDKEENELIKILRGDSK